MRPRSRREIREALGEWSPETIVPTTTHLRHNCAIHAPFFLCHTPISNSLISEPPRRRLKGREVPDVSHTPGTRGNALRKGHCKEEAYPRGKTALFMEFGALLAASPGHGFLFFWLSFLFFDTIGVNNVRISRDGIGEKENGIGEAICYY